MCDTSHHTRLWWGLLATVAVPWPIRSLPALLSSPSHAPASSAVFVIAALINEFRGTSGSGDAAADGVRNGDEPRLTSEEPVLVDLASAAGLHRDIRHPAARQRAQKGAGVRPEALLSATDPRFLEPVSKVVGHCVGMSARNPARRRSGSTCF